MSTTRRDAATAGPVPGGPMPWPDQGEASQGHLPAYRRRAVPTRESQCGGQPIHTVPARRLPPTAVRPPPGHRSAPTATITPTTRSSPTCPPPEHHVIHQANHCLDRPFHIRTPAVDRDLAGHGGQDRGAGWLAFVLLACACPLQPARGNAGLPPTTHARATSEIEPSAATGSRARSSSRNAARCGAGRAMA